MADAIDVTKPTEGNATTASVRLNFQRAKDALEENAAAITAEAATRATAITAEATARAAADTTIATAIAAISTSGGVAGLTKAGTCYKFDAAATGRNDGADPSNSSRHCIQIQAETGATIYSMINMADANGWRSFWSSTPNTWTHTACYKAGATTFGAIGEGGVQMLAAASTAHARIIAGAESENNVAVDVYPNANVTLGRPSPSTSPAAGLPMIPACNGTPSGSLTVPTGFAAVIVDAATGKLYTNTGSGWNPAA